MTPVEHDERICYFDIETGGFFDVVVGRIKVTKPIIQISAIAVDRNYRECETLEIKVSFDEADADHVTLNANHYNAEIWKREALPPFTAAKRFASFLRRHATVDRVSKSGKPYQVAQLVAHNAERFDGPLIRAWYEKLGLFCPAAYNVFCTKQRAFWLFHEHKEPTPPDNYKLGTLCRYFGVPLRAEEAHDALNDVRATVGVYRALIGAD